MSRGVTYDQPNTLYEVGVRHVGCDGMNVDPNVAQSYGPRPDNYSAPLHLLYPANADHSAAFMQPWFNRELTNPIPSGLQNDPKQYVDAKNSLAKSEKAGKDELKCLHNVERRIAESKHSEAAAQMNQLAATAPPPEAGEVDEYGPYDHKSAPRYADALADQSPEPMVAVEGFTHTGVASPADGSSSSPPVGGSVCKCKLKPLLLLIFLLLILFVVYTYYKRAQA
jgi:hypothetical protein